jgi:hypothetical protein
MFIFDGGLLSPQDIEAIHLPEGELSGHHFYTHDSLPVEMTDTLRRRVLAALRQLSRGSGVYLENQE